MEKVLIATKKPFAPAARDAARKIFQDAGYEVVVLESYSEPGELISAVPEASALIVRSDKVTAEVIEAASRLKIVVRAGAGYDNIDCGAAKAHGIVVMNTPGQNANAVAELALGSMIMAARGKFDGRPGTELKGKVLGLHGFGNVARRVARIARGGFEMEILAYDPFLPAEKFTETDATRLEDLPELYSRSDYLSLHIPATPETRGSINYDLLRRMKPNAVLVNTARAEIIAEDDLLRIYRERPGFRYLADVAPEDKEQILMCDEKRCFFTPKKMGAQTAEANFNAATAAARQIIAFFERGDTTFQVN